MDEIGAEVTGASVGGEIGEIGASVIGAVGGIGTTTGATGGSTETTGTSLFPFSAPVIIIGIVIGSSMLPGRLTGTRVGSGIISFGGLVGNETGGFVGSGIATAAGDAVTDTIGPPDFFAFLAGDLVGMLDTVIGTLLTIVGDGVARGIEDADGAGVSGIVGDIEGNSVAKSVGSAEGIGVANVVGAVEGDGDVPPP